VNPVEKFLLLSSLVVTAYLTGLIWTIQIVHYPLFNYADRSNFTAFETAHATRISSIVLLPMLVELGLSLALLVQPSSLVPSWAAWTGATLVGIIWLSTFLLQVPQHNILSSGFDPRAHAALVHTNWVRTVAWTVRTGMLGWLVWGALR
jgi:hypothetical protein